MLLLIGHGMRDALKELQHYINLGISKIEEYVFKSRKSRIYALAMSKCCVIL